MGRDSEQLGGGARGFLGSTQSWPAGAGVRVPGIHHDGACVSTVLCEVLAREDDRRGRDHVGGKDARCGGFGRVRNNQGEVEWALTVRRRLLDASAYGGGAEAARRGQVSVNGFPLGHRQRRSAVQCSTPGTSSMPCGTLMGGSGPASFSVRTDSSQASRKRVSSSPSTEHTASTMRSADMILAVRIMVRSRDCRIITASRLLIVVFSKW